MEFPFSYFEDEVRDGFYVPGMMKRNWAAQLEVLEDISKVCKKYNIQYFAEWGTLLGAVRHGGYIPWDDDMDICMKRTDYMKFVAVAEKELPEGYSVMSIHQKDDFGDLLIRVVNNKRMKPGPEVLEKFHGFPYCAGIDIFPLDFIAPDPWEAHIQREWLTSVIGLAKRIGLGSLSEEEQEQQLQQVEELCNVKFDRDKPLAHQLYILGEQITAMYSEEEADEITILGVWSQDEKYKFPKSYYQETIMMPFENTEIPVPVAYDAILRTKYGDYMRLVHSGSSHNYPYYKGQEEEVEKKFGKSPMKYTFSKEDLDRGERIVRKTLKDRAGGMADILIEAHDKIYKHLEESNSEAVLELLELCQDGAVKLGTMIEESEGEGFVTVGILEEYCEAVYQVSVSLLQDEFENAQVLMKEMEQLQIRIQESIQNDIKVRKEVVFLPYKAAMWDSLESVWKAANEDPDCDAYVIPIPYFDRKPDGSFNEMHYEGDQYPDYVPITNYESFDFAEHCPDMIFIHNPYDQCNYITSVHPFFYSKNLKKYTENLIYIPYFILDEIDSSDQRAIMNMEHFVTVPGVMHADKVIVQSEKMRQTYIDVLVKYTGEETREIWEKKILGLGSPKLDKVANTKKEDLEIPEEWRQIIQKEDGSKKKIILYNTSVAALLEHNEQMLQKIKDVLRSFKEKKNEIVLLWRPHPLIKATIESMRPQLWEEYRQIVEQYKCEGWGIYDDTADLDRAVKLCDVYYGDGSSVVQLCRKAGMPIMVQNVQMISKKNGE